MKVKQRNSSSPSGGGEVGGEQELMKSDAGIYTTKAPLALSNTRSFRRNGTRLTNGLIALAQETRSGARLTIDSMSVTTFAI